MDAQPGEVLAINAEGDQEFVSAPHPDVAAHKALGLAGSSDVWTAVVRTTDKSIASNAIIAADGVLEFPALANSAYLVRLALILKGTSAAGQFKCALALPAGATSYGGGPAHANASGTVTPVIWVDATFEIDFLVSGGARMVFVEAYVAIGATPGTVQLQWAQSSSNINPTLLKAGSMLEYRKIS